MAKVRRIGRTSHDIVDKDFVVEAGIHLQASTGVDFPRIHFKTNEDKYFIGSMKISAAWELMDKGSNANIKWNDFYWWSRNDNVVDEYYHLITKTLPKHTNTPLEEWKPAKLDRSLILQAFEKASRWSWSIEETLRDEMNRKEGVWRNG